MALFFYDCYYDKLKKMTIFCENKKIDKIFNEVSDLSLFYYTAAKSRAFF